MQRICKQTSDGIGMSEDYICSLFCHVLVLPRLCILFKICTEILINVFFCICIRFQIIILGKMEQNQFAVLFFIFLVFFPKYTFLFPTYFVMLITFPVGILVMQSS